MNQFKKKWLCMKWVKTLVKIITDNMWGFIIKQISTKLHLLRTLFEDLCIACWSSILQGCSKHKLQNKSRTTITGTFIWLFNPLNATDLMFCHKTIADGYIATIKICCDVINLIGFIRNCFNNPDNLCSEWLFVLNIHHYEVIQFFSVCKLIRQVGFYCMITICLIR